MESLLIIGMMIVTFGPRYLPFALAGKVKLPILLQQALSFVPIAVLTSIIAMTSLVRDGAITIGWQNHYLYACFAAFITALIWRNMFISISTGLLLYLLAKWFI